MLWKLPESDAAGLAPLALAYVGDAVFELYVRCRLASKGARVNQLHKSAVSMVSAKAMAEYYHRLLPLLTESELRVMYRGRNAKSRRIKSAGVNQYHMSSGFEALVGYLFLSEQTERLDHLLEQIITEE